MAKTCKIEKDKRCAKLIVRYKERRAALLAVIRNPETSLDDRLAAYKKLARIPRDASPVRLRNRCERTGRPRGYYRKFRLSRIALRELASEGKLPGVTKSSW